MIAIISIIISEVRLNIILKLFLIKTPTIKMMNIDKDKNTSGSNIFKLLIIFNMRIKLFDNYQLNYLQKRQKFPLRVADRNQKKLQEKLKLLTLKFLIY